MKVLTGFDAEVHSIRLPLDFILSEDRRVQQRQRFVGFRDSAIFHRLWDLCGVIRVTPNRARLTKEEDQALQKFCDEYDKLPWRPLISHPHVSELESDDLSCLVPTARDLYSLMQKRHDKPWWKRIFEK